MPGNMVQVGASINCPHGGQASIASVNQRVKVGGMPVALLSDVTTVAGCAFQVPIGTGTKPQPCLKVQWLVPSTRVLVNSQPILLNSSSGICQSAEQIPQGPPSIVTTQMRVKGI
jgi:hypothetical protein